jgi:hypothetical protein
MDTLNRSAIVVKPKQRFLDWLRTADPTSHGITVLDVAGEQTIYLVPECDTDENLADILRELCEESSRSNWDTWYRDMSAWPQDPIFATNLSFGIELAVPLEIKYHPFAFDDLLLANHRRRRRCMIFRSDYAACQYLP